MNKLIRLCLLAVSLLITVDSYAWVVRGGYYRGGPYYHGYAYPRAVYYGGYRSVPYYGRAYYAPACRVFTKCYASGNCFQRRVCY